VCFCCVGFSSFSTMPRDWLGLGRTSLKWHILCRVGRKTLTQSVSPYKGITKQWRMIEKGSKARAQAPYLWVRRWLVTCVCVCRVMRWSVGQRCSVRRQWWRDECKRWSTTWQRHLCSQLAGDDLCVRAAPRLTARCYSGGARLRSVSVCIRRRPSGSHWQWQHATSSAALDQSASWSRL